MTVRKPGRSGATRVRFSLPAEVQADTVTVCGDFNEWSPTSHPLRHYKDGHFDATIDLTNGSDYHYRFLLDGSRCENDWAADAYAPNAYGGDDSVIRVE